MSRWGGGDDLSGENAEDIEMLDDLGPVVYHVYDERAFEGTIEE
jgi:hypothetical protein